MKKIISFLLTLLFFIPGIVFASSTYDSGVDMANKYIYDFQDYARYIKITGELPYGVNASNKPELNASFKTGGFLNEKEYQASVKNSSSWLAPGIGFWLVDRKVLDVKSESFTNPNVVSGVRVTEFINHGVKVKGTGTKTNPWYFTDGYMVKIGSSDQSLGTVTGGCDHVTSGGSCVFTVSYDSQQGMSYDNCKKIAESKGSTFEVSGNTITVRNVHGDISCFIDFGVNNKCIKVTFNNDGGSGGMSSPIYYKYGYGWFSDSLCLSKVSSVSRPTKTGHRFNGYKINSILVIDETPKITAGIKESITSASNTVEAKASWEKCAAGTYLTGNRCVTCSAGTYSAAASESCTDCPAGTYSGAGAGSCTDCGKGKYSGAKSSSCSACPAGYTTTGTRSTVRTDCWIDCGANTRVTTAEGKCTGGCSSSTYHNAHRIIAGQTSSACSDKCDSVTYSQTSTCSKSCGGGRYKRLAYSSHDGGYRCSGKDDWRGSSCNTQSCCTPHQGSVSGCCTAACEWYCCAEGEPKWTIWGTICWVSC